MSDTPELKPGDLVQLKSGSDAMTLGPVMQADEGHAVYECYYQQKGTYHGMTSIMVPLVCLERADTAPAQYLEGRLRDYLRAAGWPEASIDLTTKDILRVVNGE